MASSREITKWSRHSSQPTETDSVRGKATVSTSGMCSAEFFIITCKPASLQTQDAIAVEFGFQSQFYHFIDYFLELQEQFD